MSVLGTVLPVGWPRWMGTAGPAPVLTPEMPREAPSAVLGSGSPREPESRGAAPPLGRVCRCPVLGRSSVGRCSGRARTQHRPADSGGKNPLSKQETLSVAHSTAAKKGPVDPQEAVHKVTFKTGCIHVNSRRCLKL